MPHFSLPLRAGFAAGLLLLLAQPAFAAETPELLCDSDAKLTFSSTWLGGSSVALESEKGPLFSLPWTGEEKTLAGKQLKELADSSDILSEIADDARFLAFEHKPAGARARGVYLFIQKDLLGRNENDGLVVSLGAAEGENSSVTSLGTVSLYHCRSR